MTNAERARDLVIEKMVNAILTKSPQEGAKLILEFQDTVHAQGFAEAREMAADVAKQAGWDHGEVLIRALQPAAPGGEGET